MFDGKKGRQSTGRRLSDGLIGPAGNTFAYNRAPLSTQVRIAYIAGNMPLSRRLFLALPLPLTLTLAATAQSSKALRRKDSFFGLHFDLHANNKDVALGRDLTPAHAGRLLDRVKPDYVQYDCKGHAGYMAYPSKVSTPAANIVNDSLAIWRRATQARNVALYIHFSGVWDSVAIQQHPEWAAVRPDGTPDPNATSLFGPYADQRMIPQLKEAITEYSLDGAWIDGECWAVRPDYSEAASAAFRKATGIATLPKNQNDRGWQEFLDFHREAFRRYIRHYLHELHRHRPSVQIASNWMYTTYMPERPDIPVDFVSGDYLGNASISTARLESRYLSAAGKPWDLMAWGFQHNPAATITLSHKTAVQLQQEASVVLAQGGGFQIYYQPTRAGFFDDRLIEVMARVAKFCRERQAFSHQTETVPSIGVVFSAHSLYRTANKMFGGWGAHTAPARGFVDALTAAHLPVDVIPEWKLDEVASQYDLIVLPDWPDAGLKLKQQLTNYVHNGGNLLIAGAENAALFAPELGVTQPGEARKQEAYIPGVDLFANMTGNWQDVQLTTATAIEMRYPAYDTNRDGTPAATWNRLGKGKIAAIYGPAGTAYASTHAAPAREFLRKAVTAIHTPILTMEAPSTVEPVLRRKGDQTILHLLNSTGMQVAADYAVIDAIPAVGPIKIALRLASKPTAVFLEPGHVRLDGVWEDDTFKTTVPRNSVSDTIIFYRATDV